MRFCEADLHTHSAMSDGTESPADVARAAAAAGVGAFALTDHDTMRGWDEACAAAAALGIGFIPGIEVSTRFEGRSIHMLAFWVNPAPSTGLFRRLTDVRESRRSRAERMVTKISDDYPITWETVLEIANSRGVSAESVGRPHIADALVAAGSVCDRTEAFASILASGSPYYARYDAIDACEAIELIHAAGGVAVGAHLLSRGRGAEGTGADGIRTLAATGLDGIEIDHREHDSDQRTRLRTMARHLGLLCTGGSDYHGSGKPNRIGENLTSPDHLEALHSRASQTA